MAPRKGTKRSASQLHGVPPQTLKQMTDVLELAPAVDLPESCKKMLEAMLPQSLCVPKDEREAVQEMAISMFGEVVTSVEEKLKEVLDAQKTSVDLVKNSEEQLILRVSAEQTRLKEAQDLMTSRDQELKLSSQVVVTAKTFLTKKTEEQAAGDASVLSTQAEKDSLEALHRDFQALKNGEKSLDLEAFTAKLEVLRLEDSLQKAILPVLQRSPAERRSFDETVLSQLETDFSERLKSLEETLQEAAPGRQARQLAVDQAKAELEVAEQKQKDCSAQLLSAKEAVKEATASLKEAEAASQQFQSKLQAAKYSQDEKQKDLQIFLENTVKCFVDLKDRLSPKRLRQLEAEAAAAAAEAAATEVAAAAKVIEVPVVAAEA